MNSIDKRLKTVENKCNMSSLEETKAEVKDLSAKQKNQDTKVNQITET